MAGTVKKLQFAEGTNVAAPTDLGIASSTTKLSSYTNDAAYVTANGAAVAGSAYVSSTLDRLRYYTGGAWYSARPDGTLTIKDSGSANTVSLLAPTLASSYSITLPTDGGTNGYALVTNGSGVLSYAAVTSNPMTTQGDITYGGVSGVPTRLAKGTSGQYLKIGASVPAWAAITPSDITGTIPGSSVTPAFGAQNISTTGTLGAGAITGTSLGLGSTTVINSAVKTADTIGTFSYGTWTPVSRFGAGNGTKSDSGATGTWLRMGIYMFVTWELVINKGTGSGATFIGGLPMNAIGENVLTTGVVTQTGFTPTTSQILYRLVGGSSEIAVALNVSGGAIGSINASDLGSSAAFYGSGLYRIA